MRNYIQLETSGVIVTEDFSTNSNQSRILLNDGEEIVLEDGVNSPKQSHVELELSEIDGDIILDGTDSSGSNAGDFLVHEVSMIIENLLDCYQNFITCLHLKDIFLSQTLD